MAEEPQYRPKDAVEATIKTTGIMTAAGLVVAGIQNTLAKQNVGAMGVFSQSGGTIATYGMLGN